ncbi:hypothetical protein JGH11_10915 [Dysgonomonas sp. Marseille-P4677]|uniref:DUF6527 family protein n=1 Tax=Dysgonomonas sp. Marseille-P4677 TaxID=2364790 RepID=UPI001914C808|nr:DUF6527 family protein [Dysgonomonas sp. Marseille-P4677]MBK5721384.1 hypothetical protein [Dysgonomonas sp. Marseille-P4677]
MRTLKKVPVTVEFVSDINIDDLKPNIMYIRKDKMYLTHLCFCEDKCFVNLPISTLTIDGVSKQSDDKGCSWDVEIKNEKITVKPSILNHPCECHYIITNGIANIV